MRLVIQSFKPQISLTIHITFLQLGSIDRTAGLHTLAPDRPQRNRYSEGNSVKITIFYQFRHITGSERRPIRHTHRLRHCSIDLNILAGEFQFRTFPGGLGVPSLEILRQDRQALERLLVETYGLASVQSLKIRHKRLTLNLIARQSILLG